MSSNHSSWKKLPVQIIYQERISKHITDRIVDVPVLLQRQVSFIQTVQKTWKIPQVQFLD